MDGGPSGTAGCLVSAVLLWVETKRETPVDVGPLHWVCG